VGDEVAKKPDNNGYDALEVLGEERDDSMDELGEKREYREEDDEEGDDENQGDTEAEYEATKESLVDADEESQADADEESQADADEHEAFDEENALKSQADSRKLCPDTQHFSGVLLVIHFNYAPRKGVLPFLLDRYSTCFQHIVTVSPSAFPEGPAKTPNVICDDKGHTVQKCYAMALEKFPGFRGYLVMNDDTVFQPKRWMSYDRDRWWNVGCGGLSNFTLVEPMAQQLQRVQQIARGGKMVDAVPAKDVCQGFDCPTWPFWPRMEGVIQWWKTQATETMRQQYIAHTKGTFAPSPCTADFLYIPKHMTSFYVSRAKEMQDVWLELFVPMVSSLWAAMGEKEVLVPQSEYFFDWDYRHRGSRESLRTHRKVSMYHPLKLSSATTRAFVDGWLFNTSF